jgi:hypothetical protein
MTRARLVYEYLILVHTDSEMTIALEMNEEFGSNSMLVIMEDNVGIKIIFYPLLCMGL